MRYFLFSYCFVLGLCSFASADDSWAYLVTDDGRTLSLDPQSSAPAQFARPVSGPARSLGSAPLRVEDYGNQPSSVGLSDPGGTDAFGALRLLSSKVAENASGSFSGDTFKSLGWIYEMVKDLKGTLQGLKQQQEERQKFIQELEGQL